MCRVGTGPGSRQDGRTDGGTRAAGSTHADATPQRAAVRLRDTHLGMAHPGAAGLSEGTGDFRHPLVSARPPPSSCHLHALRNLLQRPLELPTTSHDHLPSHVPPQKNLRPQTQLCFSAVVPFQHLQRKDPSSLCPDGQSGGSQSPQACLLGCTRPRRPRALTTGTQPALPGLCPSPPALPTSPTRVFCYTNICEGVPCILSCQSPQQTLGARTPNTVGHTPTHQLEESPAPSHRGRGAGSSLHSRPAKSWSLGHTRGSCKESPVQGHGEAAGGRWAAPGPRGPNPRLAQPTAPTPIPAWLSPTVVARPGQLSVQPKANKGLILWAEGGQGHREDVWAVQAACQDRHAP